MVVDSILPHAESGPNNHRKDAPPFTYLMIEVNINFKNPFSRTNLVLNRGKSGLTEYSQTFARPPKDSHKRKGLPVCIYLVLKGFLGTTLTPKRR